MQVCLEALCDQKGLRQGYDLSLDALMKNALVRHYLSVFIIVFILLFFSYLRDMFSFGIVLMIHRLVIVNSVLIVCSLDIFFKEIELMEISTCLFNEESVPVREGSHTVNATSDGLTVQITQSWVTVESVRKINQICLKNVPFVVRQHLESYYRSVIADGIFTSKTNWSY